MTNSNIQFSCHIMPTDAISRHPGRTNSWGKTPEKRLSANCAVSLTTVSLPDPTKEGDRGETEEGKTAQIAELSAQEVLQQLQADQKYPRCEVNCTGSIQPHGHSANIETKQKYDSRCALYHGLGCGGCIACSKPLHGLHGGL